LGLGLVLLALVAACGRAPQAAPVRLEFWTIQLRPRFDTYMQGVISRFETDHPGLQVEWVDLPQKSILQKLMASIAGGVPPDLVNLNTSTALLLAQNEALVDLGQALAPQTRDRYFPNLWEAARYRGGLYAIPWYLSTRVLIYNKSLLGQAGLDPDKPPTTWEQVARVARVVRSRTPAYGYIPVVRLVDDWRMWGVPICDAATGRALFDTPQGAARLEWYAGLYAQGGIPRESLTEGFQGALDRYKQGSLALLEAGPQLLLKIQSDAPSVYACSGVAPLPQTPTGTLPASLMNLVVPRSSKHRAQAVEFGVFLTDPQNQLAFAREVPLLPSTVDTARDRFFRDGKGEALQDEAIRISVGQLPKARDFSLGLPRQQDLERTLKEAVESALYGRLSAREALHRAAREWDRIMGVR
jgi:putative chitobiose transport system substrate-binding protein